MSFTSAYHILADAASQMDCPVAMKVCLDGLRSSIETSCSSLDSSYSSVAGGVHVRTPAEYAAKRRLQDDTAVLLSQLR